MHPGQNIYFLPRDQEEEACGVVSTEAARHRLIVIIFHVTSDTSGVVYQEFCELLFGLPMAGCD